MAAHTRSLFCTLTPIFDKYCLSSYAGEGSFGRVFIARDCVTGENVALKTESYSWRGHGVVVLDSLGDTLQTLLHVSGGVISIEKTYKIGRAMVQTLQAVHDRGYVHRDVKPDNIMLPLNGELQPYLVDFGDAQCFQDSELETRKHETRHIVGTLPFVSINVHKGMRHTRRDDIVSLAYTLIYLAHGTLPWYHCKDVTQCMKQKQGFRFSQLNSSLPSALELFLDRAQSLDFDARPDYSYLEHQLR